MHDKMFFVTLRKTGTWAVTPTPPLCLGAVGKASLPAAWDSTGRMSTSWLTSNWWASWNKGLWPVIVFCKWKIAPLMGNLVISELIQEKSYSYELWHTWVKGSVTPRDLTRLCHPFSPGTAASRGDLGLVLLCVDHFWMCLLGSLVVGWGWGAGVFHRIFPSWIWQFISYRQVQPKTLWASLLVQFPWEPGSWEVIITIIITAILSFL